MTDTKERSSKRLKTTGEASETARVGSSSSKDLPTLPVFSMEGVLLNEDIMEEIVDFVNGDGKSYCYLTVVSKSFHAALIPRQKKVWIGGFKRYEDFLKKGYKGMEFFSGRNSKAVRCNAVLFQVANRNRFPNLRAVDLTGCILLDSWGILEFVQRLGSRLQTLILGKGPSMDHLPQLLQNLVSHCSTSLTTLELCPTRWYTGNPFGGLLEKLVNLRKLTLTLEGSQPLPDKIPSRLEVLRIYTEPCLFLTDVNWTRLVEFNLPNLKTLVISDMTSTPDRSQRAFTLSAQILISIMSKSKKFETLVLCAVGTDSKLYLGKPAQEERKLFRYLSENKIKYVGPTHVTRRSGADFDYEDDRFINRSG